MHTTQTPDPPLLQKQRLLHRDLEKLTALPEGALLSRPEAAAVLGSSISTLARWACEGRGPPFMQIGPSGFVRYEIGALRRWIAAHTARRAA